MDPEGAFRAAFWVLFGGLLAMRGYFSIQVRRAGERLLPDQAAVEREGRGTFVVRAVGFAVIMAWLGLYAVDPPWMGALAIPLPAWLRWAGFGLGLVSLAMWTWTQAVLGTQWSAQLQLREEHRLVTTGPYTWVRHPLYTAMLGWAASLALLTANWVFAALAALSIVGVVARVPREEKMMIDKFGEEYLAYKQRTGRFFPRMRRRTP